MKKGLGRGIQALISDKYQTNNNSIKIPINKIFPNKDQPRRYFDKTALSQLIDSVKTKGIIQPIIVREYDKDKYQIIAGERRYRAALDAGFLEVPVIISDYKNSEILEVSLIENIQRQNLNAIEEAKALDKILTEFNYTQADLAKRIGKSRSYIANIVRLLNLPKSIQELIKNNSLTVGHVRPLLTIENTNWQIDIAKNISKNNLSVREVEELVLKFKKNDIVKSKNKKIKNKKKNNTWVNLEDLQKELSLATNSIVNIKLNGSKQGYIELKFSNIDEFNNIYLKLINV